jgi:hypothetical protein
MATQFTQASSSLFSALDLLDLSQGPALSADAYARLTSAELRMSAAVLATVTSSFKIEGTPGQETSRLLKVNVDKTVVAHRIDMSADSIPDIPDNCQQAQLWKRYRNALARATLQIRYHVRGQACIGYLELIGLLEAIHDSIIVMRSPHALHDGAERSMSASFYFNLGNDFGGLLYLNGLEGSGLLSIILDLVMKPCAAINPRLDHVIMKTIFEAWPLLAKPVYLEGRVQLQGSEDIQKLDDHSSTKDASRPFSDTDRTLKQIVRVVQRASMGDLYDSSCIIETALKLLQTRFAVAIASTGGELEFIANDLRLFLELANRTFGTRRTVWSPAAKETLLEIFAMSFRYTRFLFDEVRGTDELLVALLQVFADTMKLIKRPRCCSSRLSNWQRWKLPSAIKAAYGGIGVAPCLIFLSGSDRGANMHTFWELYGISVLSSAKLHGHFLKTRCGAY